MRGFSNLFKNLLGDKEKRDKLNEIAKQVMGGARVFTRQELYDAFREAGLSPDEAKSETLAYIPNFESGEVNFE